ncbi:MAG: hypothetical protein KAR42_14670 [candidate division Zixibacteria bacterium]|nr:hypothetical protein [candidate division Zixibacteria bacterium]
MSNERLTVEKIKEAAALHGHRLSDALALEFIGIVNGTGYDNNNIQCEICTKCFRIESTMQVVDGEYVCSDCYNHNGEG